MATKKYYWLKLKNDFFTNKKIKKLRKIAGGDTYTIIYLKMQLLSIKDNGKLFFENVEDSFAEELALELDEDVENVKVTLIYLIKNELLIEVNSEEFLLPETVECIGSETNKAELMRKKRAKEKVLVGNNVTELLPPVTKSYTEIEKDKEKEKEKIIDIDIEKKNLYFDNDNLESIFKEFLDLRKQLKAKNTDRAIKTLLNKLNKYNDDIKYQMIENSIVNSWKDVYELKQQNNYRKQTTREEVLPSWFNQNNEAQQMTQEQQEEIDNLFAEFDESSSLKEKKEELQARLKEKYGKKENND